MKKPIATALLAVLLGTLVACSTEEVAIPGPAYCEELYGDEHPNKSWRYDPRAESPCLYSEPVDQASVPTTTSPTQASERALVPGIPTPAVTPAPAPDEPEMNAIESGTYLVPSEIKHGVYRVIGYWARLDSSLGIIDNAGVYDNGIGLMVVQRGDTYIELSGEAVAIEEFPRAAPIALGYTEGTYLVGVDIQPGRYRVSDPNYAYAARLDRTLDIISNEGNSGSVIIVVSSTDYALTYSGTITRL